jgi:hypothetical protein
MATVSQVTEAVYRSRFDDQMTAGANAAARAMEGLATAVEATEERVTRSERSATSWIRANDALTQAADRAKKAKTDLSNAEKALASDLAAGGAKAEAAGRALDTLRTKAEQAEAKARALSASFAAAGSTTSGTSAHIAAFASANDNAASRADRLRGVLGQAGFQIQDFATQVAMGGNAMQAFGVQGAQMLGAFGPTGAIAGAVLMVGTLAAGLLTAGDNAATAANRAEAEFKGVERAQNELKKAIDEVNNAFLTQAERANRAAAAARAGTQANLEQNLSWLVQRNEGSAIELSKAERDLGRLEQYSRREEEMRERMRRSGQLATEGEAFTERGNLFEARTQVQGLRADMDRTSEAIGKATEALARLRNAGVAGPDQFGPEAPAAVTRNVDELRRQYDRAGTIRRDYADTAIAINASLQRGEIDQAEATRLTTAAEKERDDALQKLTASSTRMTAAQREANRETEAALRLEAQFYSEPSATRSGLLSLGKFDDEYISRLERRLKGSAVDAEAVKKQTDEANRAAERAYDQQQRKAEATYDRITDYAGNAFADLFMGTEGGWKRTMENLQRVAIATFAKIAFEAAARPIIMPVVQAFTGATGGGLATTAAGAVSNVSLPSMAQAAGANGSGIGAYTKYLDGNLLSLGTGGSPTGGVVRFIDGSLGTNVGGFLNSTAYTVGGNAQLASQLGQYADTGMTVGTLGSSVNGTAVSYGSAIGGGLGVLGGAYGIYSGLQQGGAKGAANVVSGGAGMIAGASTAAFGTTSAAGVAGGLSAAGVGAGAATALGAVAAVAPYVAVIAAIVAMLLPAQKPSNREGNAYVDVGAGTITPGGQTGDKFSEDNLRAATDMGEALKQFANQLSRYGVNPIGQFQVGFGDRDGIYAQWGGQRETFGRDEGGAKEAVDFISRNLLELNQGQLAGNYRTVYDTVGASDIERLFGALDWTRDVYEPFAKLKDQTSQYAQQVASLAAQYDPLIAKAREYGLAIEPIQTVYNEQMATLERVRALNLNSMRLGLDMELAQLTGGSGSAQAAAIARMQFDINAQTRAQQVEQQFKDLGASAEEVAIRLGILAQVTDESRQAMEESFVRADLTTRLEAMQGLASQGGILTSFLDQQNMAGGSPQQAFGTAQAAYDRAMQSARQAGGMDADLGGLTRAAESLISASSAFYGDGAQGAMIRNGVLNQVRSLGVDLGLGGFTNDLDASITRWIAANTDSTMALKRLTDRVDALYEELRDRRFLAA